MNSKIFLLIILTLSGLLYYFTVKAQSQDNCIIQGIISDAATGEALPFVVLIADEGEATQTAISDEEGSFEFESLEPGRHAIQAVLSGYNTLLVKDLLVEAGKTLKLSLGMKLTAAERTFGPATAISDKPKAEQPSKLTRILSVVETVSGAIYKVSLSMKPRQAVNAP